MTDKLNWIKKGLHFSCTGCGKCCTGFPGFVWLNEEDIEKISTQLGISREEFLQTYTRKVGKKISLKEDPKNYDCIFLKDKNMCSIYETRPIQCRTYPFWKENIASKEAWENTSFFCEGINHKDASLVPLSKIKESLERKE